MQSVKLGIVIPTLNRADLLSEALEGLRDQTEHFEEVFIIDNGQQDIRTTLPKTTIFVPGRNYGVAHSWNTGISRFFENGGNVTHVLALNDDIVLGKTQLRDIRIFLAENQESWFFTGNFFWSIWCLSKTGAYEIKKRWGMYFDPSFHPAYCEDNDAHTRIKLMGKNHLYLGCLEVMTPEVKRNSMTAKSDLRINHERSEAFYILKWGGKPEREVFSEPFNGKRLRNG